MTRGHVEGLLSSFPKLMVEGQQHTTVETDSVRYVFQPLFEDMYVVLVTSKNSNIVQDMDTLQLVARSIPEVCTYGTQDDIVDNALQLLSVFDEIVSIGYRENIDMAKLTAIMEMDSHEEKIQEIIDRNKEKEAKLELKRKAKMFEMQRKNAAASGGRKGAFPTTGGMGSYGNDPFASKSQEQYIEPEKSSYQEYASKQTSAAPATRGMKLGRKTKGADLFGSLEPEVSAITTGTQNLAISEPSLPEVDQKSVHIVTEERITAVVNRDGGLESMEVKGDLSLIISEDDKNAASIRVACLEDDSIQYKSHPNIDKNQFNQSGLLALKNPSRTYPINQPVGVLKWRYVGNSEDSIPLSINCWPSAAGNGSFEVNIEYELNKPYMTLNNVVISIPIKRGAQPIIGDVDGSYEYNRQSNVLEWQIPTIDRNSRSGSMDFTVDADNVSSFFPVSLGFISTTPYCQVQVLDAISQNEKVDFSVSYYQMERLVAIRAVETASKVCRRVMKTLVSADTIIKKDKSPILDSIDRGNYAGGSKGRHWTLDPIDGTLGFLRKEQYAICLALIEDGEVKVGVIGCPNLKYSSETGDSEPGTLFVAVKGQGAFQRGLDTFKDETRISVSKCDNTSNAAFTESVEASHSSHSTAEKISNLLNISKPPVRVDSQCKYGIIARGEADIYLRIPTSSTYSEKIWDHAAGTLLVQEAGGVVTDVNGKTLDFSIGRTLQNNSGIIATNKLIYDKVLSSVKSSL
ncbi:hypothetical protein BB560_005315 [Smittium megazygosporum]|uniref:Coatomer subunit delta n=1 Tax=Smittium megazygosporum TaxID=133381 RepID=A0A2T9Z6V6_9FUNG|nr:hypothetical protein BB560_005315 [Smittium megazygosporum]